MSHQKRLSSLPVCLYLSTTTTTTKPVLVSTVRNHPTLFRCPLSVHPSGCFQPCKCELVHVTPPGNATAVPFPDTHVLGVIDTVLPLSRLNRLECSTLPHCTMSFQFCSVQKQFLLTRCTFLLSCLVCSPSSSKIWLLGSFFPESLSRTESVLIQLPHFADIVTLSDFNGLSPPAFSMYYGAE